MREKTSSWKEQMQTHRTHPYLVDVLNLPSVRQQNYKWEWQWQINSQQPVNLRCIYSIECKDHTQFPVLQTQRGNIGKTGSDHHVHPCPLSAPRAFSVLKPPLENPKMPTLEASMEPERTHSRIPMITRNDVIDSTLQKIWCKTPMGFHEWCHNYIRRLIGMTMFS